MTQDHVRADPYAGVSIQFDFHANGLKCRVELNSLWEVLMAHAYYYANQS